MGGMLRIPNFTQESYTQELDAGVNKLDDRVDTPVLNDDFIFTARREHCPRFGSDAGAREGPSGYARKGVAN